MTTPRVMPEDLKQTVLAADAIRRQHAGERLSHYPAWKRQWIEPWFNLMGIALGQLLVSFPWPLRWRADQRLNLWLGGRASAEPADFETRRRDFVALARRLHQETGQWPAVLVFTSHPATTGPLEWLRFEVVREGLLLANAVLDAAFTGWYRRPAPQCFLAIDPYALDTIPTPVAGLYSGLMHRIYLAWDRMSLTQGWLQRHLFLKGTGYAQIAQRLITRLRRGVPVVMVLPGGLPFNARLLYTAQEFVHRLPIRRWPYAKRLAQKKWMEALIHPVQNVLPLLTGELPDPTCAELLALLAEWGIPETDRLHWLTAFAEEFKLDAPYRQRLFRVLFRRLAAKGKPFLWIAVAHSSQTPHIHISLPWGAYQTLEGDLRLIRGADSGSEKIADIAQVAVDFSKEFIV